MLFAGGKIVVRFNLELVNRIAELEGYPKLSSEEVVAHELGHAVAVAEVVKDIADVLDVPVAQFSYSEALRENPAYEDLMQEALGKGDILSMRLQEVAAKVFAEDGFSFEHRDLSSSSSEVRFWVLLQLAGEVMASRETNRRR